MAKFKIYKLHFKDPLHISDLRDDASVSQKTIHSDTLHAALIASLAKVESSPKNGDLGCVISDLFPYYQKDKEGETVYFLPMPLQSRLPQLSDPADAKKVKKVKWVDAELYSRVLAGESFFDGSREALSLVQSSYLSAQVLPEDATGSREFIQSEVMQRVMVKDRSGNDPAQPYYVDRISFKDEAGLYFLASGSDTSLLDRGLKILEMEGIGTDRYVGYGFFETINKDKAGNPLEMELVPPEDANHQITFSMFIPETEEQLRQLLASEYVAYDFTRRGGWITTYPHNTIRKNAVYAFLPGSVFKKLDGSEVIGKMTDLAPDVEGHTIGHPVWRSGQAIMLPIKLK